MNYFDEAVKHMEKTYGHDVVLSLATVKGDKPNARMINAYYKENEFYITTYDLSNKMREIEQNPNVALNHNLFVAHGKGENIGNPLDGRNSALREELRNVFSAFYDKHVDEKDPHTCILKITLTDALVFADDYKYIVDFTNKTATRTECAVDIVF